MSAKTVPVDVVTPAAAAAVSVVDNKTTSTASPTDLAPSKDNKEVPKGTKEAKKNEKLEKERNRQELERKKQQARRAKARRNPNDVVLKRQGTIDMILKYQMGQHELKKLRKKFQKVDIDHSGEIDYVEFFEFIDDKRTPFADGLFLMIDANNNGQLDFEEFVHVVTYYSMLTRDEILQFAFDQFDMDKSGSIDEQEFMRLCTLVNDGEPAYPGNFKRALDEFDKNGDGLIDFEEFRTLNKRYPLILFPCFRLQDRFQKASLGSKEWLKLAKRFYQKLVTDQYRRKHNGALPPVDNFTRLKRIFGIGTFRVYEP